MEAGILCTSISPKPGVLASVNPGPSPALGAVGKLLGCHSPLPWGSPAAEVFSLGLSRGTWLAFKGESCSPCLKNAA